MHRPILLVALCVGCVLGADWARTARVVGIAPDSLGDIGDRVGWARNGFANVAVVKTGLSGHYRVYADQGGARDSALALLDSTVAALHQAGLRAVAYISVLEVVTPGADADLDGEPDASSGTAALDHPGRLQRSIDNDSAVFYADSQPTCTPGDEHAWLSPHNGDVVTMLYDLVTEVAARGIDGICFGSLRYATHLDGWRESWASFDDSAKAAFSGSVPTSANLGDFDDADFRAWVGFRVQTLTNLAAALDSVVQVVNDTVVTCLMMRDGVSDNTARFGTEPLGMSATCDVLVYEYSPFGDAVSRNTYEWLHFCAGVRLLTGIDGNKPTWVVSYVDTAEEAVANGMRDGDAASTLMQTVVSCGANVWVSGGPAMFNASADYLTQIELFSWLSTWGERVYGTFRPVQSVGVYYSPASLLFGSGGMWKGHLSRLYGTVMMLHEKNFAIAVLTGEDIDSTTIRTVDALFVPGVRCIGDRATVGLNEFSGNDEGFILFTGDSAGWYDSLGARRSESAFDEFLDSLYDVLLPDQANDYCSRTCLDSSGSAAEAAYPESYADSIGNVFLDTLTRAGLNAVEFTSAPGPVVLRMIRDSSDAFLWVNNFSDLDNADTPSPAQDDIGVSFFTDEEKEVRVIDFPGTTVPYSVRYQPSPVGGMAITVDSGWSGRVALFQVREGARQLPLVKRPGAGVHERGVSLRYNRNAGVLVVRGLPVEPGSSVIVGTCDPGGRVRGIPMSPAVMGSAPDEVRIHLIDRRAVPGGMSIVFIDVGERHFTKSMVWLR